jgi:hypothetical protein
MYYNSALHQFRCYRGISAVVADGEWEQCGANPIDRGFLIEEEFMGGEIANGRVGALGWATPAIGTGATIGSNSGITPTADRPSSYNLTAAGANNGGSFLLTSGNFNPTMVLAPLNSWKAGVAVSTDTATRIVFRAGLHNQFNSTTGPSTGVWWEAAPTSSGFWRYCYANAVGTAVCAASTVDIAPNTYVSVGIRITALGASASTATFTINGNVHTVSGVTINTTNGVFPSFAAYAESATSVAFYVDYFQLRGVTSTRR